MRKHLEVVSNKSLDFDTELIWSISSQDILAQTKMYIMQHDVARCPKACRSCKGVQIPSLLDLCSEVTPVRL